MARFVGPAGVVDNGNRAYSAGNPDPPKFYVPLNMSFGAVSWTNMPAALTELNGATRSRVKVDLTAAVNVRLTAAVSVVGAAGAAYRVQYATDGDAQGTWAYLDGNAGPSVTIDALGGRVSPWATLVAGARADVWLRVVGINGDGAADPIVGNVVLAVK